MDAAESVQVREAPPGGGGGTPPRGAAGGGRAPVPPRASGRVWGAALLAGAVVAAAGYALMPFKGAPELRVEGAPELVAAAERAVGDSAGAYQGFGAVLVDGGGTAEAFGGTADGAAPIGAETPFETGSVWKVFTAMTLADMAEDGETSLDRTLGEVFADVDFASAETASITLEELAVHHAGLPPLVGSSPGRQALSSVAMDNVYAGLPPVETALAGVEPSGRGEWAYSNFGYAVLGEALAREAGTGYPELVRERVFEPLGMDATGVLGADFQEVPEGAALPHKEPGARAEPWESTVYAPAGVGTWTTLADLGRFAGAVADGSAPGMGALEPRAESGLGDAGRQGLGWIELTAEDGTVLHVHDGGTYGTAAFLAVDRESGRAVAAFTNTGLVPLPAVFGQELLAGEDVMGAAALEDLRPPALSLGLTLPLVLLPVLLAGAFAVRRRTLVGQRRMDRMRIVSMPLGAVAVLALALPLGSWAVTPPALWAAGLGAVAASAVAAASQWNRTVWNNARWPWLHYPFFALSVLVSLLLIGVAGWAVSTSL
ncbi:serine hydrolase domain-containing protein [Nocardiopsis potens]|uniref:serine hydrolase domain-containing protein n=1 Tax=Nocardiopsis potens TaxID=1246458 RepID=UPI00034D5B55|nr:serine hydrolase domain-containing protein [Nocardiopsis potens]